MTGKGPLQFSIAKGQYTVAIDPASFKSSLKNLLTEKLNSQFLQEQIEAKLGLLQETFPDQEQASLQAQARSEGVRDYNLIFRRELLKIFSQEQEKQIRKMQQELGFASVPASSFNPQREAQAYYDQLAPLSEKYQNPQQYTQAVAECAINRPAE